MATRPFTVQDLIACYRTGVFPMAESRTDARTFLVDPPTRGILPLNGFHASRRLRRTVRSDRFTVRIDTAFSEVVAACAAPGIGRLDTWINAPIERLCGQLFALGVAHSVEAWHDGRLVGGLYGISLGAAFFGESMFSRERDASKVCLAHLIGRLRAGGYALLDAQFMTDHLATFGAVEITRADYRMRLAAAVGASADFRGLDPYATGAVALQAISQAS